MKTLATAILTAILLAGCYKDNVDVPTLNTNVYDPDYQGPAILEFVSQSTTIITVSGVPVDTMQTITVRVHEELFTSNAQVALHGHSITTSEDAETSGWIPVHMAQDRTLDFHHAQLGTNYCYVCALRVQQSPAKTYTFCATAAL